MFLNNVGQPHIFNKNAESLLLEYKKLNYSGPLLLCTNTFRPFDMPKNWRGCVYGMAEAIVRHIIKFDELGLEHIESRVLQPYKPMMIPLETNLAELTMIPAGRNCDGEEIWVFTLKDDFITVLITNELGCTLDWVKSAGTHFQKALTAGFDVMYFNDSLYANQTKSQEELRQLKQHHYIYALVELVRPKRLVGLTRTQPPRELLDLCTENDPLDDN